MSDLHIKVVDAPDVTQLLGQDLRQEYSNVGNIVLFVMIIYKLLYHSDIQNLGDKEFTIHVVLCSICWRAWVLGWKLSKTNFTIGKPLYPYFGVECLNLQFDNHAAI